MDITREKDTKFVNVNDLHPHPDHDRIYRSEPDPGLVQSIQEEGVLQALLATKDNMIISGYRRWKAAKEVGLEVVPVTLYGSQDDLDITRALIHANKQREKTKTEMAHEACKLMETEQEEARRRQEEGRAKGVAAAVAKRRGDEEAHTRAEEEAMRGPVPTRTDEPEAGGEKGRARDKVGRHFNVDGTTAEKMARVGQVLKQLREQGETETAEHLERTLEKKGWKPTDREARKLLDAPEKAVRQQEEGQREEIDEGVGEERPEEEEFVVEVTLRFKVKAPDANAAKERAEAMIPDSVRNDVSKTRVHQPLHHHT